MSATPQHVSLAYSTPLRHSGFSAHTPIPPPAGNQTAELRTPQIRLEFIERTIKDQIDLLDGFSKRVNAISRGRNFAARKEFAALADTYAKLTKEIAELESEDAEVSRTVQREARELEEATTSRNEKLTQKAALESQRAELARSLAETERNVSVIAEDLQSMRILRDSETSLALPVCEEYEKVLEMKITIVRDGYLRFVFDHINERDLEREYVFTVNVAQREYEIEECEPALPELAALTHELNETRDFYGFVRMVRRAFSELARSERRRR
ncbi:hypothetical protein M427DRAFT_135056 [Gonapodya prolifera JEL478]|uniref:Kinetochore protein SPC25 n=1 Tax=Gonapodya prolifera (strain JEL478) TaxID=1344416 RepID=A0A139AFR8_GONPJ|nr:hypothetical protein M427DRAFT_135056 [Gonapodya prolifera JEL478]|eukprot:KXS15600.1 hypothetical protein M427DRAFT_135056 [Gonapodya prolifera JEL478]